MPDLPTRLQISQQRRTLARRTILREKRAEIQQRTAEKEASRSDFRQGRRQLAQLTKTRQNILMGSRGRGRVSAGQYISTGFRGGIASTTGPGRLTLDPRKSRRFALGEAKAGKQYKAGQIWTTSGFVGQDKRFQDVKGGFKRFNKPRRRFMGIRKYGLGKSGEALAA